MKTQAGSLIKLLFSTQTINNSLSKSKQDQDHSSKSSQTASSISESSPAATSKTQYANETFNTLRKSSSGSTSSTSNDNSNNSKSTYVNNNNSSSDNSNIYDTKTNTSQNPDTTHYHKSKYPSFLGGKDPASASGSDSLKSKVIFIYSISFSEICLFLIKETNAFLFFVQY